MLNDDNIINFMQQSSYRPLSYEELKKNLRVEDGAQETEFVKTLGSLEKKGEVVRTRKNKYGLPHMMNLMRGTIRLSERGYGILVPEQAGAPEVFIYGKKLNGAMHNDRVMVRIHEEAADGSAQRPEGSVIRVLERANKQLVGTYQKFNRVGQVIPDDVRQIYPIYVRSSRKIKTKPGDRVVVQIDIWPGRDSMAEGRITEVLGGPNEPGLDLQVLIKKHSLRSEFPAQVIAEARLKAQPVQVDEIALRQDLRGVRMVTIDGEDAKDLDDAVNIKRIPGGYQLGVHIADVSHYVREGGALDQEAYARGTSVYLIDTVLPMLPQELSNDICSLNAGTDRLAISCIMDIDAEGNVIKHDLCKSVIRVRERMTYAAVNKLLARSEPELNKRYEELIEDLFLMQELAGILRNKRLQRGALDFEFPESKVIVDEKSFPVDIIKRERGAGEMLIEDFMIQANEVVAAYLYDTKVPILYRVHEKPDEESMLRLNNVLGVFGYKISGNKVNPKTLQKILADIKGRPEEQLISLMMLRSLKHARYTPQALGHFGLSSEYYCHFTSPIRRYPDLVVHRALSQVLEHSMNNKKKEQLAKIMPVWGEQSTLQEMKAEEAERELIDIKKAQYMSQFIGEEFTGKISSVQPFGIFVELDNTVEGLVHISSIVDDYYVFNDDNYSLNGKYTGKQFSIGDTVQVQLAKADVINARIDFELLGQDDERPGLTGKRRRSIINT